MCPPSGGAHTRVRPYKPGAFLTSMSATQYETPPDRPGSLAILPPCEPKAPVFITVGRLLILTLPPISPGKLPVPDLTGCSGFVNYNLGVGL